jgi:hypothetical protein
MRQRGTRANAEPSLWQVCEIALMLVEHQPTSISEYLEGSGASYEMWVARVVGPQGGRIVESAKTEGQLEAQLVRHGWERASSGIYRRWTGKTPPPQPQPPTLGQQFLIWLHDQKRPWHYSKPYFRVWPWKYKEWYSYLGQYRERRLFPRLWFWQKDPLYNPHKFMIGNRPPPPRRLRDRWDDFMAQLKERQGRFTTRHRKRSRRRH